MDNFIGCLGVFFLFLIAMSLGEIVTILKDIRNGLDGIDYVSRLLSYLRSSNIVDADKEDTEEVE